jgi:hypothetical protein
MNFFYNLRYSDELFFRIYFILFSVKDSRVILILFLLLFFEKIHHFNQLKSLTVLTHITFFGVEIFFSKMFQLEHKLLQFYPNKRENYFYCTFLKLVVDDILLFNLLNLINQCVKSSIKRIGNV